MFHITGTNNLEIPVQQNVPRMVTHSTSYSLNSNPQSRPIMSYNVWQHTSDSTYTHPTSSAPTRVHRPPWMQERSNIFGSRKGGKAVCACNNVCNCGGCG